MRLPKEQYTVIAGIDERFSRHLHMVCNQQLGAYACDVEFLGHLILLRKQQVIDIAEKAETVGKSHADSGA